MTEETEVITIDGRERNFRKPKNHTCKEFRVDDGGTRRCDTCGKPASEVIAERAEKALKDHEDKSMRGHEDKKIYPQEEKRISRKQVSGSKK